MKLKILLIYIFTFMIPLLTPYGYWVVSYADPFLIGRDLLIDSMGARRILARIWRLVLILSSCIIVYFIFRKDRVATISAICSIISETLDFLLTTRFHSLKIRPVITVACNVLDTILFMILVVAFKGMAEINYNIFIDTLIMAIVYFILFFYTNKKTALFKNYTVL